MHFIVIDLLVKRELHNRKTANCKHLNTLAVV